MLTLRNAKQSNTDTKQSAISISFAITSAELSFSLSGAKGSQCDKAFFKQRIMSIIAFREGKWVYYLALSTYYTNAKK